MIRKRNEGITENRVKDISVSASLAGSAQQLSNIAQAIETNNTLPPSDSGIRKKKYTVLSDLGKNKVFSHFECSPDKKGGWFTLNPGYTCFAIIASFATLFKNNQSVMRYFSNPRQDGMRLYVSLNHPHLQNASAVEVQTFFALLIRTRLYVHQDNNEVLLEKSQVTPGDSDSEVIVRFDELVEVWHREFPILNKTIISDVLATWFIAAINQWREQRYDANEDHRISTEWIQHGGEFVRVTNYWLLQDNFSPSLAHWEVPLPQDLSLNPSSEVFSDQSLSCSVTPYAWDARQQAETGLDIAASPPHLLSSEELLFGVVDTPLAAGKRRREEEPNSPHKKQKNNATEGQNAFSYGARSSLTFFQNSVWEDSSNPNQIMANELQPPIEGGSLFTTLSFLDECNEYEADLSHSDALQGDERFGDEAAELFRVSPSSENRFLQNIVSREAAPNNPIPDKGLQQAEELFPENFIFDFS
jgi:hypothetical protein